MLKLLSLCLLIPPAFAADSFYLGTWRIEGAAVAPWWTERGKPDAVETKALLGKIFVIGARSITGPRQLACPDPRYKVIDSPSNMLFQGAFEEMRERDKSVDPAKIAASVGFRGSSWKTLETGCGMEIDFHFIDPETIAFGLNNYIYKAKKQR